MIEWASPWAFALLVPVWGLLARRWLVGRNPLAVPSVGVARRLTPRLLVAWLPGLLRLAGLTLLVFSLARPRIPHRQGEIQSEGLDILLVLDTSHSMHEPDFTWRGHAVSRLAAAKAVVREFVEGRPDDRIGLIVFGDQAFTFVPLTLDHDTLGLGLDVVQVGMMGNATAIGDAIGVAAQRAEAVEAPERIVILLTDGENTAGLLDPVKAARSAGDLGIRVYTIGVGARHGGRRGRRTVGFDEATLRAIARATGAEYFRATSTDTLREVYATIDELEPSTAEVTEIVHYEELYRRYLVPGVLLLLSQVLLSSTWLRRGP